jgi:hypothetical protein
MIPESVAFKAAQRGMLLTIAAVAVALASMSFGVAVIEGAVLCQSKSGSVKIRPETCKAKETPVDIEALFVVRQDKRFSLMWRTSSGDVHSAAIRGNASIRSTTDPSLIVDKTGTGQYCITVQSGLEGAVGVLQRDSDRTGIIRVTAGIGNPCPTVPLARYFVETFSF